jgi:hypothetical protein
MVPGHLRHGHPLVEGERRKDGIDHEYDPPGQVSGLGCVEWRMVAHVVTVEGRGHGDHGAHQYPEPVHGEHDGDECASCVLVGELGHDRTVVESG